MREFTDKRGYVYLMYSAEYPDYVKIGYTKTADLMSVYKRGRALSKPSGNLLPFQVINAVLVDKPRVVEGKLHKHFAKQRVVKNREFFELDIKEACAVMATYAVSCLNDKLMAKDMGNDFTKDADTLSDEFAQYQSIVKSENWSGKRHYNKGLCFYLGKGVEANYAKAKYHFEEGAKLNNPDCLLKLKEML